MLNVLFPNVQHLVWIRAAQSRAATTASVISHVTVLFPNVQHLVWIRAAQSRAATTASVISHVTGRLPVAGAIIAMSVRDSAVAKWAIA